MIYSTAWVLLLGPLVAASPPPESAAVTARLDALIVAEWQKHNVQPEALADDAVYLRRVWLDLGGRVPPATQARAFLDDRSPEKRTRLVEALLASDDFADHWGRVWAETLTGKRPIRQETYDGRVLHAYLRDGLKANKSYGALVSELISGSGLSDTSGPANFLARYEAKPANLAGAVARQFLGVSLQCAQCHDHPFASWKQDDFWGVAAFFARVRLLTNDGGDEQEQLTAILEARRGELLIPDPKAAPDGEGKRPKKTILPRFPVENGPAPVGNRRPALAAWITGSKNPWFARHAVNQVWTQLLGSGLVSTLDREVDTADVRGQVLDLLADDFRASGYDLKRLVRIVVTSRVYQLGSGAAKPAEVEQRLHQLARFPVRPLSADQLFQAVVQATGYRGEETDRPDAQDTEDEEPAEGDKPVEFLGERALSLQRTLALLNSAYVHRAVQVGAKLAQTANGPQATAANVEWLFLATLARRPNTEEAKAMLQLAKAGKTRPGLEDVLWVLLNSAEFNTNH
jgi:hypothetical protein